MSHPLRIAYAMINCNRRDGSARAVNEVAERMALEHQVDLFARRAEEIDLSNIRWRKMPGIPWPEVLDFASYYAFAKLAIFRSCFDIVHSVGINATAANVITVQNIQPAKGKVFSQQSEECRISFARKFSRRLYLKTTAAIERKAYTHRPMRTPPLFLPVSRGVEKELRRHYEIGPALVRIIPNAADPNVFKPLNPAEREGWRQANGFSQRDIVLIFAGGEWARKGLDIAIQTLGKIPKVKLFIAGNDPDYRRFESLASIVGVRDRVIFGGFRRNMPAVLGGSDIFFFPSRYEAFSLATIEAAACGLPIVASRINGAEDFIKPGENGFFIEHDAEHAAKELRLVIANAELRKKMGRSARKLVETHYTWDRVAAMTENAYFEYLEEFPVQDRQARKKARIIRPEGAAPKGLEDSAQGFNPGTDPKATRPEGAADRTN
jgi:glycosyltransferase involved in cell wall biosynthesis